MPFRIGFEFQMGGELCKWAMKDYSLQKSPIFEIGIDGKKLFHIELDGPDIEFVTIPFSHLLGEKIRLEICTNLITNTLEVMMQLCNKSDKKTTIAEWFEGSSKINNIWIKQCELFYEGTKVT